jgi:hypothetical protein
MVGFVGKKEKSMPLSALGNFLRSGKKHSKIPYRRNLKGFYYS